MFSGAACRLPACHELNDLVRAQIDLNHPDKLGNTSLHQAALFDQSVMIHMFLEKGASTTATNNIGEVRARTPVHIAEASLTLALSADSDQGGPAVHAAEDPGVRGEWCVVMQPRAVHGVLMKASVIPAGRPSRPLG